MPPLIDQRVRNVYIALATDVENRRKSVAWIIDAAEKRLQKMRNPPRVPGKSWAYDFVPKILKRLGDQDWFERPWSLGSLADPRFADGLINAGELVTLGRHAKLTGLRFTNRQARWAVRLADVVGSKLSLNGVGDANSYRVVSNEIARTQGLLLASQTLSDEELWAVAEDRDIATTAWIDDEAYFTWPVYGGYLGGWEGGSSVELAGIWERWNPFYASDVGERSFISTAENRRTPDESDMRAGIRGGRLYPAEVQRLINAIYKIRLPDGHYWASKVTLDQFEMALVIIRSACHVIDERDELDNSEMVRLATAVTEILGQRIYGRGGSLSTIGEESIAQWRSGNV